MHIYPERAYSAIQKLGNTLNLSPIQVAFGVIDVVNIQMERALRVISVERGHDPREYSLFSFGGAGGLHAADLARNLGIPRVIISKYASTLSAYGMLASDVIKDYVQTVMLPGITTLEQYDKYFSPLVERGIQYIKNHGIADEQIEIQRSLDIRYTGQSYELNIPFIENFIDVFAKTHASTYGYSYSDMPIEIVNIRVRAIGKVTPICLPHVIRESENKKLLLEKYVQILMRTGTETIPLYNYDTLLSGTIIEGPALIVSTDTTIFVNQGDMITIDEYQNLLIDIHESD
jgi:N-methylhydantoinase A